MTFGQYFAIGMWSVTIGTYISQNTSPEGLAIFGSSFIGIAAMSGALGALVSPLVFGSLADGLFSTERLLSVLNLGCAAALALTALATSQTWFFVGLVLYYQFAVPTITLGNSLSLRHFKSDTAAFPIARSAGTVGWIVAMLLVGTFIPVMLGRESIEATTLPIWLGLVSHVVVAAYSLALPHTPPLTAMVHWSRIARGWGELLRREPKLGRFMLAALLATIGPQFYNVILNAYMNQIGVRNAASWMAIGQVTEVIVILLMPAVLVAIGPKQTFFIGLVAWIVRYALIYFGGAEGLPFVLTIASIALHGVSYSFVYLTGFMYVDRIAPRESSAVAQGMFAMATSGFGHLTGSALVAWCQSEFLTPAGCDVPPYDWPTFWLVPLLLGVVATVVFWGTMGLKREVY